MSKNAKNIISTVLFAIIFLTVGVISYIKPQTAYSDAERRPLAQRPEFSANSVLSGNFMNDFENYSADQFFSRDFFRSIKAYFSTCLLNQSDNNGLYEADGHISSLDKEESQAMIDYGASKFQFIYDTFLKDTDVNVYFSIVPDKNFTLAPQNGYPSLDYEVFIEKYKSKTSYMEYIEIRDLLSSDDYYKTDSHWKQENITDIAIRLGEAMGVNVKSEYTENVLENPFRGVYAGQSGLYVKPDTIKYLTSSTLDDCKVTYYNNNGLGQEGDMYDMEKAYGKDPYEMFLGGVQALIEIENPNIASDRELVLFRDSFGSSIAPLLAEGYRKITIVDIRYIQSFAVGSFVNFDKQDVLFLYSTGLLNNSTALR